MREIVNAILYQGSARLLGPVELEQKYCTDQAKAEQAHLKPGQPPVTS